MRTQKMDWNGQRTCKLSCQVQTLYTKPIHTCTTLARSLCRSQACYLKNVINYVIITSRPLRNNIEEGRKQSEYNANLNVEIKITSVISLRCIILHVPSILHTSHRQPTRIQLKNFPREHLRLSVYLEVTLSFVEPIKACLEKQNEKYCTVKK